MKITIDTRSGFCFGVVYAIRAAEEELNRTGKLYCLGDIVHNTMEVERLKEKGMIVIGHEDLQSLHDCKVLIRAHGEPPETYRKALNNNIELIDASCPVVLKLQNKIRLGFGDVKRKHGQIVIYGKEGHAEVNGLVGQTGGRAIIINGLEDLQKINFNLPVRLFSQTTRSTEGFVQLSNEIEKRLRDAGNHLIVEFFPNDTICRQVSNRAPQLHEFSLQHEVIIFVSDKKSSNGVSLFKVCSSVNNQSYFISKRSELQKSWFLNCTTIGICGATSTPQWVMDDIAEAIMDIV